LKKLAIICCAGFALRDGQVVCGVLEAVRVVRIDGR
jgi:hypothetical protein